jgi:hypothetical protein
VRDAVRPEPGTARQRNQFGPTAFRGTRQGRPCEWPKVIHTIEIDVTAWITGWATFRAYSPVIYRAALEQILRAIIIRTSSGFWCSWS